MCFSKLFRRESKKDLSKVRAQFFLKRREDYNCNIENVGSFTVATGMYNSSKFICDMLKECGATVEELVVIDNNSIDREVTRFRPTHVFIEGLWCLPSKFDVLKKLHPTVSWIVRIHSDIPFLATEGVSMDWIHDYLQKGVSVAANSPRMHRELKVYARGFKDQIQNVESLLPLLTNYYPKVSYKKSFKKFSEILNIGCFGAIRPLKNFLTQASSAHDYAQRHGKYLKYHINGNRVEGKGEPILKNLRAYFSNLKNAELVEHPWASHEDFLKTISEMDAVMQVSFSETFNIVGADAISQNVPLVGSTEIPFLRSITADPTSTEDIVETLDAVLYNRNNFIKQNVEDLNDYCLGSKKLWENYLGK